MREDAMDGGETAAGSPSPEDVAEGLALGMSIVSEVFGVVVAVVGGIATLADGTEVPVEALGTTTAGGAPLPPETWIPGVPNVAAIGLGIVGLVLLLKVL